MGALRQDIRYSLRSLAKSPGFTAVAVATLALGIGANTAMFSIVDGVLLKPLPYAQPERLVAMEHNVSLPELLDLEAGTRAFDAMGGFTTMPLDLTGGGEPLKVEAGLIAEDFFGALGTQAARGRVLRREDDAYGGERVAVVGHALWQQLWGADPGLVGRTITLGGLPYTVIGMLPASFQPPEREADLFVPLRVAYPVAARERGVHFLRTVFRLKRESSVAAAWGQLDAECKRLASIHPEDDTGMSGEITPLLERIVGDSRRPLAVLSAAVGFVLLIACTNLANLLFARGASRRNEMAIRTALGAGRGRLVRQGLTESAVLAVLGGAGGLLLAVWGTEALLSRLPGGLPRPAGGVIDARIALFTAGVSLLAAIGFGLAPAWKASSSSFAEGFSGARGAGTAASRRTRGALVVAETALALVLLVGAGLLLTTLTRLLDVPPGFDPVGLTTVRLDLPEARYSEVAPQTAFRERVLAELNAVPGIQAALVSEVPLGGGALNHNFLIEGRPPIKPGEEPSLWVRSVMGDYFRTMRIALKRGRDFTDADRADSPQIGIVNESMARQYFPGADPIGGRIRWARQDGEPRWIEIVGVAADVNHFGLAEGEMPAIYVPYAQSTQPWKRWTDVVVRAPRGAAWIDELVRRKVWAVDSLLPVPRLRSMEQVVAASLARQRFQAQLLAFFAGVALLLSSVGIYGVMGTSVRQRTTEIGIRLALGAAPDRVLREVMGEGLRLTAAGIGIGLVAAAAASRALSSLLYGVRPIDPATYAIVALALVGAAMLACCLPARRAARIDPMRALRAE